MYYFELFDIPVSLNVNKSALMKKYYQLSKEFHPDHFSLQSAESQEKALKTSTDINEAKKILDNPYKRLEYILKEKNIIEPDEKYTLPPAFLGEMMDINEQLMELEFEPNEELTTSIKESLRLQEEQVYNSVSKYFDMEELQCNEEGFQLLKDFYYKRKYLQRIQEKIS